MFKCVCVMLQEAKCAYIIIIMAVYWCTEVIPLGITSLIPAVFYPVLGVRSSKAVRTRPAQRRYRDSHCSDPSADKSESKALRLCGAVLEHAEQPPGFLWGKMVN